MLAILQLTLPGIDNESGLTIQGLFASPGEQDADAATGSDDLALTVDANDTITYWSAVEMDDIDEGEYRAPVKYADGGDAGFFYFDLTNTTGVHIGYDQPKRLDGYTGIL